MRPRALALLLLLAPLPGGCREVPRALEIPAHENPSVWAPAIAEFARQDRETPFGKDGVVFVGSSSIRFWSSLGADMAPIPVLNRGFGGSKLFDALYYSHELVSVHEPCLVVVFSGTNDLSGSEPKSALEVRELFRRLVARLRSEDRTLAIAYIAITPTLAREEHVAALREANRLIRLDCAADPLLEFIDPTPALVDSTGRPDPQWFRADRLHLNERGYALWTQTIRPSVARLYERELRARRKRGSELKE